MERKKHRKQQNKAGKGATEMQLLLFAQNGYK
nr:MAG TPA: hypothetical protein [Caudoviricetes sp.]